MPPYSCILLVRVYPYKNLIYPLLLYNFFLLAVSDSGKAQCKAIACNADGLFTSILDGGDLVTAMAYYYQYYATLRDASMDVIYWTEPYVDFGGAGVNVTGPSLAVYDDTVFPPILIGVASMNIRLSYFSYIEPDYDTILNALYLRSSNCPNLALEDCQLENFRYHTDMRTNSTDELCGISNCTFPAITPPVCIGPSQIIPFCNPPRLSYYDEECCSGAIQIYGYHYWLILLLLLNMDYIYNIL